MDQTQKDPALSVNLPGYQEAWQMVLGSLQAEMSKALYDTWVQPLKPIGYQNKTFTIGAFNPYGKSWVEERLSSRIEHILENLYEEPVKLSVTVSNSFYKDRVLDKTITVAPTLAPKKPAPSQSKPADPDRVDIAAEPSNRKMMLQRAYGSERARIIQPERGMFITGYLFSNWLPLIGHSAFAVILAARSLCYWNPMTGELRNVVETEMGELANRAAVSVRTVKDVLNDDLVMRYFLRYRVRRVMTSNGVRTAGISLQVRMDDPLTPTDQVQSGLMEEEEWYLAEFSGEKE